MGPCLGWGEALPICFLANLLLILPESKFLTWRSTGLLKMAQLSRESIAKPRCPLLVLKMALTVFRGDCDPLFPYVLTLGSCYRAGGTPVEVGASSEYLDEQEVA